MIPADRADRADAAGRAAAPVGVPGGAPVGVRYAVIDVETSGLKPRRDALLQVGVVVVDEHGRHLGHFGSLVAPRRRWWYRVGPTHIHGITRRQIRHAPPAGTVIATLADHLRGAVVVAHNAAFDIAFLRRAARRCGIDLPLDEALCTLRLSRRLDPQRVHSHALAALCTRYGVQLDSPHDALADAQATAAILPMLLAEARQAGIDQLVERW